MVALRGDETNCEWQSQTANQADYQAVNKHFIKNNPFSYSQEKCLLFGFSTSPKYSLRCQGKTHAPRSFHSIEESFIIPLNDQIERRGKQLGHVTS